MSHSMPQKKVICVIGVTGNQGSSVAQRFIQDPTYHVRGLTRDPSSSKAQELAAQGIEVVQANLDEVSTLQVVFAGANIIFSVTNYWEPFWRSDCRQKAAERGISCRQYAYEIELQQGKNIADAAAQHVDSLEDNGFIVSTLSHAQKSSRGEYRELYHFDAKADVFPDYVANNYPNLAGKMSCVQTGYFMSSYKLIPDAYFKKTNDGSFWMTFPTAPHVTVPHLDVNADMGNFVYAVSKMPPGRSYMAEGTTCSWTEYMRLWSEVNSVPAVYRQASLEEFVLGSPDAEFGREAGDMLAYSTNPGYDGGDKSLLKASDIRQAGIDCPMTSLEQFMKKENWLNVLQKT
ncbi:NAD(P)-binding protein [Aspergillus avenaceus]|uniref:NAD(P)-binding protein n=1 Tax=Aspergillus avenaceus TaxID=36643 RepID=A0A5N6TGH6_ASPAV|nr:NAD(P)-binding protein [Aspergillus avenaceus]